MASVRELDRRGLAGFEPDWEEYTGRAYRYRVVARPETGRSRWWPIGWFFERSGYCEAFAHEISRKEWRGVVSSRLREGDAEVRTEIVYKDYERGKPIDEMRVLRGTRYPVVMRAGRITVLWSQGERYEKDEAPLPGELAGWVLP